MDCVICLETDAKKISVASPTPGSFRKLLEQSTKRAQCMVIVLWTLLNIREILTLWIYSPRMLFTTKVVMQTLETPPKSSVQRNNTLSPLKVAKHLWFSEKQADLPLQQLNWKKKSH